jgi:hypothetical protein
MSEYISNKKIVEIHSSWSHRSVYMTSERTSYAYLVAENKLGNINWSKNLNEVTTLPDNAKLYFHKTSKFPRHKLELTSYKRKIKETTADYMVANYNKINQTGSRFNFEHAWETDDTIYVSYLTVDLNVFKTEYNVDLTNVPHYTNYRIYDVNFETLFYIECLLGKYSLPIITDKHLNDLVDAKLDRITIDEFNTLDELIKSRDKENINLALKLFAQFNLSADPTFSWLFLSINFRSFSGINSVLYTNLKKRFQPSAHLWYNAMLSKLTHNKPKDEQEKELITYLLRKWLLEQNYSINVWLEFKKLGYDLKVEDLLNE